MSYSYIFKHYHRMSAFTKYIQNAIHPSIHLLYCFSFMGCGQQYLSNYQNVTNTKQLIKIPIMISTMYRWIYFINAKLGNIWQWDSALYIVLYWSPDVFFAPDQHHQQHCAVITRCIHNAKWYLEGGYVFWYNLYNKLWSLNLFALKRLNCRTGRWRLQACV